MALLDELNAQMKAAMIAKDKATLTVVRSLKSAIVNEQIKVGHDLTSDEEKSVLATQLKQRKESVAEFKKGGRDDLVAGTAAEITFIEQFLPAQMDEAEVSALIDQVIQSTHASGKSDFGTVMKALMPQVKGRADGAMVNRLVKAKLG
ncbi:GatB/YqeY domain-containing protein [Lacticaseibacillus brantae]|uniref:GatB YqeY domain-containing protein n=1 Tax=Lacticaseibacillus brantae DSM 23927 TaxID=1423727 RepID=A0A0R2B0D3_9LACO|nr:GatB/YqeY domain-containing protein [Lacticaseibacillus brantae]KRM72703.1 GatB YqeY domain-containing protein [Lacticaseibacillus brantae DSM 23927]